MRLLLIAVLLVVSTPAWAASRVAIVRPLDDDADVREATVRLAGEIQAAGFEAVIIDATAGVEARRQVESTQMDPPPFATVAIFKTDAGAAADVWVADHMSDKTVVRRIDTSEVEQVPGALAIRAVELMQASLLEVPEAKLPQDVAKWMETARLAAKPAPAPPLAKMPDPPPVAPLQIPPSSRAPPTPRPAAPRPSVFQPDDVEPLSPAEPRAALYETLTIALAPAALIPTGGLDPAFAPALRVSFPLWRTLFARVSLLGTLVATSVDAAEGGASIRQEGVSAELGYAIGDGRSVVVPLGGLGIGVHHLGVRGMAEAPFDALTGDGWAFVPHLDAALAFRLARHVALTVDARLMVMLPEQIVEIAGNDVGSTGVPMVHLGGGALAAF